MINNTTENFIKVMTSFVWPEPVVPSFRLYYNEDGTPKCYSMESMPGKYVEVDAETFALRPWNIRVVDEQIKFIQPPVKVQKLTPNNEFGTPCDCRDVCVVVSTQLPHTKWNLITNETD